MRWALLAVLLFGLLWSNALVLGAGVATVAGCVGKWYWTREEDRASIGRRGRAITGADDDVDGDEEGGGGEERGRRRRCCCKREGCLAGWAFPFTVAGTILRFHLGTLALGSLLVAVVQFIRWMFELACA